MESPRAGGALPAVRIGLPDGRSVTTDSGEIDRVLSGFFRREVRLVSTAPASYAASQAAFFAKAGLLPPDGANALVDRYPVSVMATSTLTQLNVLRPESRFDQRRFRMNLMVGTRCAAFIENDWVGRTLTIGSGVRLAVALPDPRCTMTTLAQEESPQDAAIFRLIVQHNSVPIGSAGLLPCAGVYAVVAAPGMVRCGDGVTLA